MPQVYNQGPQQPRLIERFRWWILALPLAVPVICWLLTSFEPALRWGDLLDVLQVQDRERYSAVCVLAAICSAILACTRVLRQH